MDLQKMQRATSNVFLGGTPASERFHTSSAATYVDTKDMLVKEASSTSKLRQEMRKQGQVQHFELGAESLTYETGGFQRDHFAARTAAEKEAMAADARLLAFKKKNMQAKHFELGLKPTNYTSLAAASFLPPTEETKAESLRTLANAHKRKEAASRTNFTLGATPTEYTSEAAAAFAAREKATEEAKGEGRKEKTIPLAKTANITIGLVPVDYTTAAQHTNAEMMAARAKGKHERVEPSTLQKTNWVLGLDDNKAEGHYTSQTMKDMWHADMPDVGAGGAAVRTVSAFADRRVVAAASADTSEEFVSALKSMGRKSAAGR